ncbi:BREX-1 system adenine-specific DNA-methyltransferase PglX [Photobacterium damselae]|uniref:BREX-1 system adenine-specific DNA-methyltransferase PglX n=1 Tax=Photobacterium damselae TaxID=38293 RepID=UPI001EFC51EB|nr:BREX-1 system adenine-specific DNA-methyltransferase PglX [Photobacterium damselae]MCG9778069.1 BREX-1 system adenine-specific DNA-methyltransferase PglX [Photobacterium damselae]
MNTNKLKAYAPKARLAFMEAVTKRAAFLGLYADRIAEMTIDGDSAVIEGRVFTRQQGQQRTQLVKRIEALGTNNGKFVLKDGFNQFINETAFTWFNRLTAIRYMEVNEYLDHGYRVLSNGENAQFGEGFEILGSAADVADDLGLNKESIIDMVLDGNKEEELYRAILLGQCHQLSQAMPFMFEKLDDTTELLLPDNLTKTDSILKDLVNDIPEDNWQEIEVIGWLYQFYISEHKDAVIGKVVKREDIPAATQLFTPNWIVKYLVQNSLGRQWLATYPDSELKEKMEYYITPAEQSDDVIEQLKAITPTSIDPEEIKVLDPACGSGHILVEVYEVLREIYLERGYRQREIPELILTKNIYGLDIDDRAAQMAAFAVMMKAREDDKRIFSRDIKLNIHSIQSTENLNINQLWADLDLDGNQKAGSMGDLFAEPQLEISEVSAENKVYLDLLRCLKAQFIDAKNLGSLIEVDSQHLESLATLQEQLAVKAQGSELTSREAAQGLLPIVEQATVLAIKYDVAVANPPYMGSKGMNAALKDFAKKSYPNSKSDLFAIFMERVFHFLKEDGYNAQVNMQSWMFLSSFEKMRESLLDTKTIITMAHLGARAFGQISGEVVQTTAWILSKKHIDGFRPSFLRLIDGKEADKKQALLTKSNLFTSVKQDDFKKIPGSPMAYWMGEEVGNLFESNKKLSETAPACIGMMTTDNDRFLRRWWEVSQSSISLNSKDIDDSVKSKKKWFPYNKGGSYRKWAGNKEYVVNWKNEGQEIKSNGMTSFRGKNFYFKQGITWSDVTSGNLSCRKFPQGFIHDISGHSVFPENLDATYDILAFMNTTFCKEMAKTLNPTLHFQVGDYSKLPKPSKYLSSVVTMLSKEAVDISEKDWDGYETGWGFLSTPFLNEKSKSHSLTLTYEKLNEHWVTNTLRLKEIEEENNKIFIESYSLQNELSVTVPLKDITLNCNKYHHYKGDKNKAQLDNLQQSDSLCKLISYILGCLMGRYSLDREGLVYAHSGNNGFKELVAEGAYKTFPADDDGIVPLADEEWLFDDDATTRFREFVKTVWGEDHLQENLDFVAESLCLDAIKPKKGESSMETIRRYFSTQFFKDHLKTYKKRPIYWLFSSGKEKAFECLVYLHRYNESTLSRMRTEYVTPLMGKLESRKNILEDSKATATGAELRAIDKELKTIDKKQAELVKFDEELKHLAEMKISIDLDDGVKVNYGKFGNLLADVKAIHGKAPEKIK